MRANELYQSAAVACPTDERPLASLAYARYLVGDLPGAMDACVASLRIAESTVAWNNMSRMFFERGELLNAEYCGSRSLKLDPREPLTLMLMARIDEEQGIIARAREFYERAVVYSANPLRVLENFAFFSVRTDDYELARSLIERIQELDPENATSRLLEGRLLYLDGSPEKALEVFPDSHLKAELLALYRGETALRAGQDQQAIDDFLAASHYQQTRAQAFYGLARAYRSSGQTEKAAKALEKYRTALVVPPTVSEYIVMVGEKLDSKKYVEAFMSLRQGLEQHPASGDLYLLLASAFVQAGSKEEAQIFMTLGERLSPVSAELLSFLGDALHDKDGIQSARQCWMKCLLLKPDLDEALSGMRQLELGFSQGYLISSLPDSSASVLKLFWIVDDILNGKIEPESEDVQQFLTSESALLSDYLRFHIALILSLRGEDEAAYDWIRRMETKVRHADFFTAILADRSGNKEDAEEFRRRLSVSEYEPVFYGINLADPTE